MTPIKVAINAVPLMSPLTGIGHYVRSLSYALEELNCFDLQLFYGTHWSDSIRSGGLPLAANSAKSFFRKRFPYSYEMSRWLQQQTFNRGVKKHSPALYHETSFLAHHYNGPTVLTVHDLSWIYHPEAHPLERVRAMEKLFPSSLDRADKIITDTETVKHELVDVFGVASDRIRSVHLAADTIFKPMTSRDTKSVLSKVGVVHKNYWLAVGTLEPRKNLLVLLEAFAALPASIRKARPLVIVGSVGWKANALLSKIERMKRTGEIIHLGYLERSALAVLFAGASALVFTSIYEGFGLPLIEAMQSGTAVLASDISCLPEVAKGGALYFDPHSPDDLTRLLQRFFEDKTLNTQMTLRSLERSKHFSWQKSAKETADVYRAVLKPDQTNF